MKFRRRAKLFPGVYLNFSRSGISTTIGVPGASINFNKYGTYLNTGIPGTGFYDRKKIGGSNNPPVETPLIEQAEAIRTENAESTTTEGLLALKSTLLDCYVERFALKKEVLKAKSKLAASTFLLIVSYL